MNSHLILGLHKNCSLEEVKSSYRRLAKIYHPDVKGTGSSERFRQITEAYNTLIQISPSRPKKNEPVATNKIFRVIDGEPPYSFDYPEEVIEAGTRIFLMVNHREIRIFFSEDMSLPTTIRIDKTDFRIFYRPPY